MKKLLTLLIVAALAVSMAACTSPKESSSSVSESTSSESSVSSESSSEESASSEGTPEFEIPEANQKLGDVLSAARSAEDNEGFSMVLSKDDPSAQLISDVTGLKYEDMESFAVSVSPMNVKAYGVAIIKPVAGKEEAVNTALKTFVENQQKSFENYLPDQKEVADAASIETLEDGTIVMVMCEDAAAVQKAIVEGLKK